MNVLFRLVDFIIFTWNCPAVLSHHARLPRGCIFSISMSIYLVKGTHNLTRAGLDIFFRFMSCDKFLSPLVILISVAKTLAFSYRSISELNFSEKNETQVSYFTPLDGALFFVFRKGELICRTSANYSNGKYYNKSYFTSFSSPTCLYN